MESRQDNCEVLDNTKLIFPVVFDLKVIMIKTVPQENQDILKKILVGRSIPHDNWSTKPSKEGKYISFTVQVTIHNKEMMDILYADLKQEPLVKFAI